MCQGGVMVVQPDDVKRSVMHAAAISEFSERGFNGTSMSNIAAAAGMSRPALYQYFKNKGDIFASAFVALLDDSADAALGALASDAAIADRLDGFLQRFEGDLWETMSASPYADEIMSAKTEHVAVGALAVIARLQAGLTAFLENESNVDAATRNSWIDLLRLSPRGFKLDEPTVEIYRGRLTALARTLAADIERSSSEHKR
jgi:AcrR family transcriptional regulator